MDMSACDESDLVVFTGHSRGGALTAIMAGIYDENHSDKDIAIIIFGEPRSLRSPPGGCRETLLPKLRIVNEADPIAGLPSAEYHWGNVYQVCSRSCCEPSDLSPARKILAPYMRALLVGYCHTTQFA